MDALYEWKDTNDGIINAEVKLDERWVTYNMISAEVTFSKAEDDTTRYMCALTIWDTRSGEIGFATTELCEANQNVLCTFRLVLIGIAVDSIILQCIVKLIN